MLSASRKRLPRRAGHESIAAVTALGFVVLKDSIEVTIDLGGLVDRTNR